MELLRPRIAPWFKSLTDSQLRTVYGLVIAISIAASASTIFRIAVNSPVVSISDDTFWAVADRGGHRALVVGAVVKGGVAEKAGVQVGDEVVAIDNIPLPAEPNAAQKILNKTPAGRPVPYSIVRNGNRIDLPITLREEGGAYIYYFNYVFPVFSLLLLLIGSMVALAQPRGIVQQRFFFMSATAVFIFSNPPVTEGTTLGTIVLFAWPFATMLFGSLWVKFCRTFPVDQPIGKNRWRKALLYLPTILYALDVALIYCLHWFGASEKAIGVSRDITVSAFQGIIVTYFIVGVWFLFRGYRMLPATADKRPSRIILGGSIVGGLCILYLVFLSTAANSSPGTLGPQYFIPIVMLLALPASFGYAIFKYQVMDFRKVMRTTAVYGITMLFVGGTYLGLGWLIGRWFGSLIGSEYESTVGVIIFVLFVLALEEPKRKLQNQIENRFFPRNRDYVARLSAYSQTINEAVGTDAVAHLIAHTLRDTLNLRGVWVALENSATDQLEVVARETNFALIPSQQLGNTELRQLLHETHTLVSLETAGGAIPEELEDYFSYAVGLYSQGREIGVVLMSRPEDDAPLTGSQTPFITGVTTQGASALEVARLYEEELARQRYHEELATARRIQESLLPATMPVFPGISISAASRPAQAVGGDYYEVIALDSHRFLVMIADVSGKGLPASLYMAELHGMVRIAASIYKTPKEILSTLNSHLCEVIEKGSFITASLLLFDTERKTVSFARAGHTPIMRRNGSKIDSLIPVGLPLGIKAEVFDQHLQQYTVSYEEGETFILYSDGVSEAMNSKLEEFGEGRLNDVLAATHDSSAHAVCRGILEEVEEFRDGFEQNDDVSIVVVRIEKAVEQKKIVAAPAGVPGMVAG